MRGLHFRLDSIVCVILRLVLVGVGLGLGVPVDAFVEMSVTSGAAPAVVVNIHRRQQERCPYKSICDPNHFVKYAGEHGHMYVRLSGEQ